MIETGPAADTEEHPEESVVKEATVPDPDSGIMYIPTEERRSVMFADTVDVVEAEITPSAFTFAAQDPVAPAVVLILILFVEV